jgi:hypothetical protein
MTFDRQKSCDFILNETVFSSTYTASLLLGNIIHYCASQNDDGKMRQIRAKSRSGRKKIAFSVFFTVLSTKLEAGSGFTKVDLLSEKVSIL